MFKFDFFFFFGRNKFELVYELHNLTYYFFIYNEHYNYIFLSATNLY